MSADKICRAVLLLTFDLQRANLKQPVPGTDQQRGVRHNLSGCPGTLNRPGLPEDDFFATVECKGPRIGVRYASDQIVDLYGAFGPVDPAVGRFATGAIAAFGQIHRGPLSPVVTQP